ncbi:MAG: gamma-glutamyltransferase family protein, partial [Sphingomonadales bacterium]
MKKSTYALLLSSTISLCVLLHVSSAQPVNGYQYTIEKSVVASKGAVVSAHPLASKVGLSILQRGGNAIDAAIATQLALAVVYPNAGNIGGGGFMVAHLQDGKQLALDYREKAPAKAYRDMYIEPDGKANTDKSQAGHLSCGVPGTIAGLFAAHAHAKLPFALLITPAIMLAEKGFVITAAEARGLNNLQADLKKYNTTRCAFVKDQEWKEGDTLVQTDLANTLKRIRQKGQAGFYEGQTADLIEAEMKRGRGLISKEDLRAYKAQFREPHRFTYKEYNIVGMPMPSSGGVLLHQMLKMVEKRSIATMGFHSPASVQLMTEVMRRAYADRAAYMGDADFFNVPVEQITSESYLEQRMKSFAPNKATSSTKI